MTNAPTPGPDQEGDPQDNFVESREPTELAMCFILAAAYLGLARYCWTPLSTLKNWKLLVNVEGFFITIAVVSILVGLRPYITPSNLQVSGKGIKYRGPYWPQRKTVNWEQIRKIYLSPELILVLYVPNMVKNRSWPMLITSIYLADRDRIATAFLKYSPIPPVIMNSPNLLSRIILGLAFLAVVVWLAELLTS